MNTGEVVANTDENAEQRLATGDAVNVAARLEQAAPANEVLIGEVTYDLVRAHVDVEPVEPLELKGKAERVPAYRLIDVRDAARARALPGLSRSAGRARRRSSSSSGRRSASTVGRGGAHLATVVGRAGRRQDLPRRVVPVGHRRRDDRAPGAVPALRRRHHLLAARRDRAVRGRHRRRRHPGSRHREDRRGARRRCSRGRRSAAASRPSSGSRPSASGRRDLLGGATVRRGHRRAPARSSSGIEDAHNAEETFLDLLEHLLDTSGRNAAVLVVATGRVGADRQAAAVGGSSRRHPRSRWRRSSRRPRLSSSRCSWAARLTGPSTRA